MKIGTWNLEGRWDARHEALLREADCDIWLLTEVSDRLVLDGFEACRTTHPMSPRRDWSAVLSRLPMTALEAPHLTTAAASINGTTYWSSVLPWRGAGSRDFWPGMRHGDWTTHVIDRLRSAAPKGDLVWGGDWNHALAGREHAGSVGGRREVLALVEDLGLQVPTTELPHRLDGLLSIDHLAVPITWSVTSAERIMAANETVRLSDHDAYVITCSTETSG